MCRLIGVLVAAWFALPLSAQEAPAVAAALAAASDGEWDSAYALVAGDGDVARDLVTWMRLRGGVGVFQEYPEFLAARSHWPGLDRLRAEAERLIDDGVPTAGVLAFFDQQEVQTGEGAVAYAHALSAEGRRDEAEAMLTRVWQGTGLDEDGFNALEAAHPDLLLPHHMARADAMLWRWRTEDAERLLPHLDEGERALVRARLGYIGKVGDVEERVALVPERLRDDPGLYYDRFNWLADRGDWTDAVALLRERSVSAEALKHPWRWGSWRRILARWQMREGEGQVAYDLASRHFLNHDDSSYADLEWLSGYLALTYLDDPALALAHFERFRNAVSSPISLGRAWYWLGRTQEALGDEAAAGRAYGQGAQHQTTFYGLLSAEALGLGPDPDLAGGEAFPDWQEAAFLTDDIFQAGVMLLSGGERGLAVLFFADLAQRLDRTGTAQLGQLLLEMDEPFFALLIAKTGVKRDFLVQDIYFPRHPLADMDLPVEPALALAIARQESEFRVDAGSAVGALGLMQLMPGTARDMAAETGESYSRWRLTSDWAYNARLGSAYLAYLQEEFGDSPVLIAVGYNAGPGRVRQWIEANGDPRRGQVDVVDWIEHIPFRETRNYVMRVTEGLAVYRQRLDADAGAVRFSELLRGANPVVRPKARPNRAADVPSPGQRPVARP